MKDYSSDIAELQKLTKEFEKELAGLGVNVEDMKKQLAVTRPASRPSKPTSRRSKSTAKPTC